MIDKSKIYKTRDGREVRIYATDGGGEYPVHGAHMINGQWLHNGWTACGGYDVEVDEHEFDLIEVKPRIKREVWANVYRGRETDWVTMHDERDEADAERRGQRIACVKLTIDVEEGEGL